MFLKSIVSKFVKKKIWYFRKKIFKFEKKFKKVYPPSKHKIKTIIFDTTNYHSELCEISLNYTTDKSPFNKSGHLGHRHAYTGIYDFLFDEIKNKNLNICEIGILHNEGAKLFREYFKNSKIYCFDNDETHIEEAKNDNLKNVFYNYIDVTDKHNIANVFKKINVNYDIIIDDSTHIFSDQIKIIETAHHFMNDNSFLIIEDIFKNKKGYSELDYFNALSKNTLSNYSKYYFIESKHRNEWSRLWNNSKIFVLRK